MMGGAGVRPYPEGGGRILAGSGGGTSGSRNVGS